MDSSIISGVSRIIFILSMPLFSTLTPSFIQPKLLTECLLGANPCEGKEKHKNK